MNRLLGARHVFCCLSEVTLLVFLLLLLMGWGGPLGSRCQIGIRSAGEKLEKCQWRMRRREQEGVGRAFRPCWVSESCGRRAGRRTTREEELYTAVRFRGSLAWAGGTSLSKAACLRGSHDAQERPDSRTSECPGTGWQQPSRSTASARTPAAVAARGCRPAVLL